MNDPNSLKSKLEGYADQLTVKFSSESYQNRLIFAIVGLVIPAILALTFAAINNSKMALYSGILGALSIIMIPLSFFNGLLLFLPTIIQFVVGIAYFGLWVYGIIEVVKFADSNKGKISRNM